MMKKILIFTLPVVFFCSVSLFAENRHMFTKRFLNGHYIVEAPEQEIDAFIDGVIDGIAYMAPDTFYRLYPGMTRGEIAGKVKEYYKENPSNLDRSVAELIKTGCR